MLSDEEKDPSRLSIETERGKIEELRKNLYSKSNPPPAVVKRRRLHERPSQVSDVFKPISSENPEEKLVETHYSYSNRSSQLFKKILIGSLIFFVAALGVAAYVYFRGSNLISSNNITLSVITPDSVAAGAPLLMYVDITNRNNIPLELADLTFDYPEGTKSAADFNTSLKSELLAIDNIASGATIRKSTRAVLYGPENSKQDIKVTLTYRVPGSNAVFTKVAERSILIASAPVTLAIETLKEINSDQEVTIKAHIKSNAASDINNLLFQVDYPFGFSFIRSTPLADYQNKFWKLGNLLPGGSRDITIVGKLSGGSGEDKVFHFQTGVSTSSNQNLISTVFINDAETIAITKPFLQSQLSFDDDPSSIHVVQSGQLIHGRIDWQNNLPVAINDVTIQIKLDGSIIDKSTFTIEKGYYRSLDNTILWDKNTDSSLGSVQPGSSGAAYFSFSTYKPTFEVSNSYRNPIITTSEITSGRRSSEANVPETISASSSNTIKVASNFVLNASAVHSVGPFANSGPVPPKAEVPTTYTINWAITNSYNRVDNAVVVATLPGYVTWLSRLSPSDEQVSYNPVNKQITWNAGMIEAGTGYNKAPKILSFQISLLPSLSQAGVAPKLINETTLKGVDNFTGVSLVSVNDALDTQTSTDPNYHSGDDQVVK